MPRLIDELYIAQAGVCCYCEQPMWIFGGITVRQFAALYGLTLKEARKRQATREHLIRRADGGKNVRHNLALSCAHCNSKRNEHSWVLYKSERMGNRIPRAVRAAA